MSADSGRLEKHTQYLNDPAVRQEIFKKFAPTFCFHSEERHFPLHLDEFVQNVIEVKYEEYTKRQAHGVLTQEEQDEFSIITNYLKLLHHKVVPQSPPVLELEKLIALNVPKENGRELTLNADRIDQDDQRVERGSVDNEKKNSPNPSDSF